MPMCEVKICGASVVDGSGAEACRADVMVEGGRIAGVGDGAGWEAREEFRGEGLTLAPGFIDTHTHDDTSVVETPEMWAKLSQGVTTVVVGNCGISASPVTLRHGMVDPMHLLGAAGLFRYPTFGAYVAAVEAAGPAVNVAGFAGHTALRADAMDALDRTANATEMDAMRAALTEAMESGALGLSTGLAYGSAIAAGEGEVRGLVEVVRAHGGMYATHLRSEGAAILEALTEARRVQRECGVPVVVSHLKCAGVDQWGRSGEVLQFLDAGGGEGMAWDCYPYAASSSTLDLRQVDARVRIVITWSEPHPAMAGRTLEEIAAAWGVAQVEAARKLQPAGAVYFCMAEEDVKRVLRHPVTMIGSDGLPHDPRPHPRLWGTFPRVLGRYCREQGMFSLPEAVRKMTGAPAEVFGLKGRGLVREGFAADLVLFDAEGIRDEATFERPEQPSQGIRAVWVNGVLASDAGVPTGRRGGRFLRRLRREERAA